MLQNSSQTQNHAIQNCLSRGLYLLSVLVVYGVFSSAMAGISVKLNGPNRFQSHEIASLEADLRAKSGLNTLSFRKDGKLDFDTSANPEFGSALFRQFLTHVIGDGTKHFVLANYQSSYRIHFAETGIGEVDIISGITTFEISFDLSDYKQSSRFSHKDAFESHTIGLSLFHEIDHKVSYDPLSPIPVTGVRPDVSTDSVRGVIENTNAVRKELGLIPRKETRHRVSIYKGPVKMFRSMVQIAFTDDSNRAAHVRWKP